MAQGQKPFLIALAAIVVAGGAFIAVRMSGGAVSIPANPVVTTADTAGFRGDLLGSATAPIEITEYADFECPGCGAFATVQFPDIKARLIDPGKARFRYRDFPLAMHRHARVASHAAACADEQGKFWPMEEGIYARQTEWSLKSDAVPIMQEIAVSIGANGTTWLDCMKSAKFAGRIQASYDEGVRLGVPSTPTFLIEGRLFPGMSADQMVHVVDSLIAAKSAAPAVAPNQ